ncbi:MAG: DsbA family oxidoreductase [Brumimicrobium sp.]|nr:DsbA family oxidoreductase [Brumimicrobium sp.]
MKIDIWSDVMCPFCFIGKKRLEKALKEEEIEQAEITFHSFLLDPEVKTDPDKNVLHHLAAKKGITVEEAKVMYDQVTEMAKNEGLNFNLNQAVVANSINAHRILHFAKTENKQPAFKEGLLRAYFEEGKNIDDPVVLANIAEQSGLNKEDVIGIFNSSAFKEDVIRDIQSAQKMGVRGVPFFVFNDRYSISGAQPTETFRKALSQIKDEAKQ